MRVMLSSITMLFLADCTGSTLAGADGGSPSDASTTTSDAGIDRSTDAEPDAVMAQLDAATDAAPDAAAAAPIDAPADTWTFVAFPESRCAYGTSTGIGINPHPGATTLLVFLEGGGACSNATDCYTSPAAAHLSGYDATTFGVGPSRPAILTRVAQNPLAEASMVFVPYCTGDLHSGSAVVDFDVGGTTRHTYFHGALDMEAYLARIAITFPDVTRVVLAGTSAGAFGTTFNFDRVREAFHDLRVDVIDDSGPAIDPTPTSPDATATLVWGTQLPPGCCADAQALYDHDRAAQPASRYAFLSYEFDSTIGARFGYGTAGYPVALDPFVAHVQSGANAATFIVNNTATTGAHVVESRPASDAAVLAWLSAMLSDDPSWTSTSLTP